MALPLMAQADAIVLPDWEQHKQYIASREQGNDDGGATTGKLQQVIEHRERIRQHAEARVADFRSLTPDNSIVPTFRSVAEAAEYLASLA